MPATARVPLGPSVLARRWYIDVNTNTYANPTWTPIFGVEDFAAPFQPKVQSDADFDSGGWDSSTVAAIGWQIKMTLARKVIALTPTAYDVGQEVLRAASILQGTGNVVDIRWYEMNTGGPKVEAYRGYGVVTWAAKGGAMDALEKVDVTIDSRGAANAITHPDGAQVVPVLYSITPVTCVAAGLVQAKITGTGFFLAGVDNVVPSTGVKFGTTAAGTWITESDNVLYCVVPAHAQGAVNVTVYNATGVSISTCTFTYT